MSKQIPTLSSRLAIREYPVDAVPLMNQKWRDLLFMHWEYDADEIQKTLPKGLYVDCFQNKAYIGITPFFMKEVSLKLFPVFPGISDFLEINVRTYVYDEAGVPGVWFYSLDANSFLAVQAASNFFFLPYIYADMEANKNADGEIAYHCKRQGFEVSADFLYKGTKESIQAEPDSLEFFLTERYALFADKGEEKNLAMGRVYHKPYPLYKAEVKKWDDKLIELDGLKRPARAPDHIVFSSGVDVEVFGLTDLGD